MQKELGGKIAFAIGEVLIVDTPSRMGLLPPGAYTATLVQKTTIPSSVRRQLKGHDLWKAL